MRLLQLGNRLEGLSILNVRWLFELHKQLAEVLRCVVPLLGSSRHATVNNHCAVRICSRYFSHVWYKHLNNVNIVNEAPMSIEDLAQQLPCTTNLSSVNIESSFRTPVLRELRWPPFSGAN